MIHRLQSILRGCAEILLLRGSWCGLGLLAILALRPNMLAAGLLALAAAYAAARMLGIERTFLENSFYIYNPLFVGLSIGWRFALNGPTCALVICAGVLTLIITIVLANLLVVRLRLPVLSLPFALAASAISLAVTHYAPTLTPAPADHALLHIQGGVTPPVAGFCRAVGAILFLPSVLVGGLLSLLILMSSRILFGLAVAGFAAGTAIRAMLLGSPDAVLADGYNFTFLLLAMAVGGVFLVPSLQATLLAMAAVAVAVPLLEAWLAFQTRTGIPPLTLPFCLVTLASVYALRLVGHPLLATSVGGTPEANREDALVNRLRYPGQLRTLELPFSGRWTVWQGFDGPWTHQGVWRYACDFVVANDEGRTTCGPGNRLQDYYCYGLPVLSPVRGQVVRVINHLPDNLAGNVDGGNNWGNLVILYDPRGFYVELSHFSPGSIEVREGEWIERGRLLGRCGNSGYSPQPHIHVQVQTEARPGAETVPFSFVRYRAGDRYCANDAPRPGEQVEPLYADKRLDEATMFLLDDEQHYQVLYRGRSDGILRLRTAVGPDGVQFLHSDRARLYFGKHEGTFYFYRLEGDDPRLAAMFLALPHLPLAYHPDLAWRDWVPTRVATRGLRRECARLASFVYPPLARIPVRLRFAGPQRVESLVESAFLGLRIATHAELDPQGGFASFRAGQVELRRIAAADAAPSFPLSDISERSSLMPASTLAGLAGVALVMGAVQGTAGDTQTRDAMQQSQKMEKGSNYAQAIAALAKPHAAHPDDYVLNLRLGWLNYLSAKHDEALRYYRAAIRVAPKSVEAKLGCLLPMLAKGQYQEAETLARQVIEIDPRNYYANLRLAVALRWQRKFDEAHEIVEQMLAMYPTDRYFKEEQALVDALRVQSTPTTDSALAADDTFRDALRQSWESEAKQDYAAAIRLLVEQYNAHPNDYLLNLRLGWLYYLSGDYRNSAQYYYQAIQQSPRSTEAGLGYLLPLLAQARYADAEAFARQILQGHPDNYYANWRLAVALRWQAKYGEAEKVLRRMLELYPADVGLRSEMAEIKLGQNDRPAAKQLFTEVLAIDPNNATAARQLRGL
jgi:tetratricopeptide (TPR) repeat protein/urea transporter